MKDVQTNLICSLCHTKFLYNHIVRQHITTKGGVKLCLDCYGYLMSKQEAEMLEEQAQLAYRGLDEDVDR